MSTNNSSDSNFINHKNFDLRNLKLPFGVDKILRVLPQRWPLLLVDRVDYVDMTKVVAVKANTIGEACMVGHFPHYPVTPGVSMIEACAQTCTLLAYFRDHHPLDDEIKIGVRMVSLDNVRLRNEVLPGDVLVMTSEHLNTKKSSKYSFHKFRSVGKVGDVIAIEAEMTGYFFNDNKQEPL